MQGCASFKVGLSIELNRLLLEYSYMVVEAVEAVYFLEDESPLQPCLVRQTLVSESLPGPTTSNGCSTRELTSEVKADSSYR